MAPQSREKHNPRTKLIFDVKEIILYGSLFGIAMAFGGWYFGGWLGLKSSLIGLVALGVYVASEVFVDRQSQRMQGRKAVALIVASFGVRLIALLVVSVFLYMYTTISLLYFLLTIAFGFTAVLFLSVKNWLS